MWILWHMSAGKCRRGGGWVFWKKTVDVIYGGSLRQNNLLAEGIYFRQTLRLAAHAAFVVVNDMVCLRLVANAWYNASSHLTWKQLGGHLTPFICGICLAASSTHLFSGFGQNGRCGRSLLVFCEPRTMSYNNCLISNDNVTAGSSRVVLLKWLYITLFIFNSAHSSISFPFSSTPNMWKWDLEIVDKIITSFSSNCLASEMNDIPHPIFQEFISIDAWDNFALSCKYIVV